MLSTAIATTFIASYNGNLEQVAEDNGERAVGDDVIDICGVNGTVLLARNHADVRVADSEKLASVGLNVLEAWSTDDALSYLESRIDIRVVICDADMPGCLNGFDLARFVHERWPHIKIIVILPLDNTRPALPLAIAVVSSPSSPSDILDQVHTILVRN